MTSFKPGDRVTDGKRIGYAHGACPYLDFMTDVVFPDSGEQCIPTRNLRPAWQECKDCEGDGFAPNACDDCPTCKGTGRINRQGPYRLANGEWSDGHDRRRRINIRSYPLPWEVWQFPADKTIWLVGNPRRLTTFPTHAEAINYATRMAQQGDK